jgi:hypothetical protein
MVSGMRDDAFDVVLVHLEVAGAARLQAAAGFFLVHAPLLGDGGQRAAGHLGVRGGPAHEDVDHAVDQVFAQHGGAGHVGVDVHGHRLARGQRFDQRQGLLGAAPVGGAGAFVVRDDERHAGAEGGVAGFVQGFDDAGHLVAQVRAVDTAEARHHAGQAPPPRRRARQKRVRKTGRRTCRPRRLPCTFPAARTWRRHFVGVAARVRSSMQAKRKVVWPISTATLTAGCAATTARS